MMVYKREAIYIGNILLFTIEEGTRRNSNEIAIRGDPYIFLSSLSDRACLLSSTKASLYIII